MTVLSIMVVTYLLTMRHQRLSAQHYRSKTVARQVLDTALVRAMQYADRAMLASNYVSQSSTPLDPAKQRLRRVYPVGTWYSRDYQPDPENPITDQVDYQTQDILTVPVIEEAGATSFATNALTVNLLTEEVRRLLPPALTNRLGATDDRLRSGWVDLGTDSRISFAVVNCSGFIDAHTYDFDNQILRPATQSYARAYYNEQDLLNDRGGDLAGSAEDRELLAHLATFSYDPGPSAIPSERHGASASSRLGYRDFAITNKFNLNALTNYFDADSPPDCARLHAGQTFETKWLSVVSNALDDIQRDRDGVVLGDAGKVAWNIAAYMSPSRVPQISYPGIALGSRADYGIEAVPLVNEVALFNCVDNAGNADGMFEEAIEKIRADLLAQFQTGEIELAPIVVSNVYAATAELWYPFVPRPITDPDRPDESMRVYLGVYTNKGDVTTTTNSQWTAGDLAGWYDLDNPPVAELQARLMHDRYERMPDRFTNSVFWLIMGTNELVATHIQQLGPLDPTNLLTFATGLAVGFVGEFTDPGTGVIAPDNEYIEILDAYAPPPTNLPPDQLNLYYAMASNYIPPLVTWLTSRVDDVDFYDDRFSREVQSIIQQVFPAEKVQVGPFGDMWTPEDSGGQPLRDGDFNAQGFFAVTNNRDLAYFPLLVPPDTQAGETLYRVAFQPLGLNAACKTWVRPLVAVKEPGGFGLEENDTYEAADEALLTEESGGKGETVISVLEWPPQQTGPADETSRRLWSLSVADPRNNAGGTADADQDVWYPATPTFGSVNARPTDALDEGAPVGDEGAGFTDEIPGVAELPFIHADAPLRSVGELGYVTTDLAAKAHNREHRAFDREGRPVVRDTIDFGTAVGASLLDRFTVASTNRPMRGLVQANTPYPSVIRELIEEVPFGWTNLYYLSEHLFRLGEGPGLTEMTENWTNALFKTYDLTWDRDRSGFDGWRCFAEMLPDLATNAARRVQETLSALESDPYYRHDFVEDLLRGLVDKVSFRQNIFVVVIAAQALSPISTAESPVVLSDQRAAVTVLRDAYTGRWMVYNWVWLTE